MRILLKNVFGDDAALLAAVLPNPRERKVAIPSRYVRRGDSDKRTGWATLLKLIEIFI